MKTLLQSGVIFLLSWLIVHSVAAQTPEAYAHFVQGNAYYERARFDSAALEYEHLLADSLVDPMVYYNLGNAYFRLQQYPRAILNYERALKLSPDYENVAFNLALARSFTVDKLEVSEEFPLWRWWGRFCALLSAKGWSVLSFVFLALTLLSVLLLRFFVSRAWFRKLLFLPFLGLFFFVMTLGLSFRMQRLQRTHDAAVIMQSVVSVKGSPDAAAKDLFLLHAGTKVVLLQKIGSWYEIAIPDGHQGWVEESILQVI
ncbi:MAG: tetratricopeptide repeat protein [Bacteroides sp.]